jgi:hypothetical protein
MDVVSIVALGTKAELIGLQQPLIIVLLTSSGKSALFFFGSSHDQLS